MEIAFCVCAPDSMWTVTMNHESKQQSSQFQHDLSHKVIAENSAVFVFVGHAGHTHLNIVTPFLYASTLMVFLK